MVNSYIQFDFSDGECNRYPIIVRIESPFQLGADDKAFLDKLTQDKIDEYVENQEYWDSDEILIDEIMAEFKKDYEVDYEIITIDYFIDCE
jgi:hypothetical protein